eukprot:1611173-Rhodomonas_salina.1
MMIAHVGSSTDDDDDDDVMVAVCGVQRSSHIHDRRTFRLMTSHMHHRLTPNVVSPQGLGLHRSRRTQGREHI